MSKLAAIFVAAAMAVTAACVAVIASYGLGLSLPQALLCGLGALVVLAVTQLAFSRGAPQDVGRLDDIDHVVTELQSRLETLEARLATLDGAAAERARAATKPVVEEIAALGGLVTTIAKEVASHDVEIEKLRAASRPPSLAERPYAPPPPPEPRRQPPQPPAIAPAPLASPAFQRAPEAFDPADAIGRSEQGAFPDDVASRLERALATDRIEPHLQPIVTLPSRRISHYEALARLTETEGFLPAEQFLAVAAARGRMAEIDRRMLERCAPVALRLAERGGGAVFVNLSLATLNSPDGRAALQARFEGASDLGRAIVFEMAHAEHSALAGEGLIALDRLRGRGARLSLDHVESLKLDPRELLRRGVRFVKVEADRLLDPEGAKGMAIHPADLAGLMSRHGVELVATHVEDERTVPELLDMEVRLAQGSLFGVPRPVRPASPDLPGARPAAAAARLVPRAAGAR